MPLVVRKPREYNFLQGAFLLLGFFPFNFQLKNLTLLRLYQKLLYFLVLPALLWFVSTQSTPHERSYINQLAKEFILFFSFVVLWVSFVEADVTIEAQSRIFTKFEEMGFITSWTEERKLSKVHRRLAYLLAFNVINTATAIANEYRGWNFVSRLMNLWIIARCSQFYFYEAVLNEKLDQMKPVLLRDERNSLFIDLKPSRCYDSVLRIKKALTKVQEVVENLNASIGWSLLFILTYFFVVLICHGYWLFLNISSPVEQSSTVGSLCAIAPKAVILGLLVREISQTNSHIYQIKQHLFKLSRQHSSNEDLNLVIRETLMQTQEEIAISAYGFLKMDYSMLSSMFAAIGTYLIIMIQFHEAAE